MAMTADDEEDTCDCEKIEHLLSRFGSCITPPFNTCVDAFRKIIHFSDIKPGNIFTINIIIRECLSWVDSFLRCRCRERRGENRRVRSRSGGGERDRSGGGGRDRSGGGGRSGIGGSERSGVRRNSDIRQIYTLVIKN